MGVEVTSNAGVSDSQSRLLLVSRGRRSGDDPAAGALLAGDGGARVTVYQQRTASAQVGTFDVEFAVRNLGDYLPLGDAGTCPVNNGLATLE